MEADFVDVATDEAEEVGVVVVVVVATGSIGGVGVGDEDAEDPWGGVIGRKSDPGDGAAFTELEARMS